MIDLAVLLFLHPGQRAALDEFEEKAAAIMARHGGKIERRVRLSPTDDPSRPDEVHVVTFPDEESFARYGKDPATLALSELRATIVRETVVWAGVREDTV